MTEDKLWEEEAFAETIDPNDKNKMRTFHMKHDKEMNYNCRECNAVISAHNKDWHDGKCDSCFNKMFSDN